MTKHLIPIKWKHVISSMDGEDLCFAQKSLTVYSGVNGTGADGAQYGNMLTKLLIIMRDAHEIEREYSIVMAAEDAYALGAALITARWHHD